MNKHKLRKITHDDSERILVWRNSPEIRRYMFTNHEISESEHSSWFEKMMGDTSSQYFIFEMNDTPMGVCALTDLNLKQGTTFWAAYQSPDARPGTGALMEFDLLEYVFNDLGLRKICGEVLALNKNVISLHKSFGFVTEGIFIKQHFDGHDYIDVHRFALFSQQWPEISKKYAKLLKINR